MPDEPTPEPQEPPLPDLASIQPRDVLELVLTTYPAKIYAADEALNNHRRLEYRFKERMEQIEAEIAGKVALERTGEGKQKFPNEAARQGRVLEALKVHTEYQHLRQEVWDKGSRLSEIARFRNRLEEELKSARLLILNRAKFRVELVL